MHFHGLVTVDDKLLLICSKQENMQLSERNCNWNNKTLCDSL